MRESCLWMNQQRRFSVAQWRSASLVAFFPAARCLFRRSCTGAFPSWPLLSLLLLLLLLPHNKALCAAGVLKLRAPGTHHTARAESVASAPAPRAAGMLRVDKHKFLLAGSRCDFSHRTMFWLRAFKGLLLEHQQVAEPVCSACLASARFFGPVVECEWQLSMCCCSAQAAQAVFVQGVCVCADSPAEGLNVAVGHAGCSQPAIVTAIPGLPAVGDGPQSQPGSAVHAIAAPGLASAAAAIPVATGSPVTCFALEPAGWCPLIKSRHPCMSAGLLSSSRHAGLIFL